MKNKKGFVILILFCFISVIGYAQEKLFYDLYYSKNPKHKITTYNKILLVSNASIEAKAIMRRDAKKANYNVILYDDLFPAYKKWAPEEVDSLIFAEDFDAFLTVNITDIETYQTSFGGTSFIQFGNYAPPIAFTRTKTTTKVSSTKLEIYLIDKNTAKNEYVIFITGSVDGKPQPAACRSLYYLLLKFEKLSISYPPIVNLY